MALMEELEALSAIFHGDPSVSLDQDDGALLLQIAVEPPSPLRAIVDQKEVISCGNTVFLHLALHIPDNYPSEAPPELFGVLPSWLPDQVKDLVKRCLNEEWEHKRMPCLYDVITLIRNRLPQYLPSDNNDLSPLHLTSDDRQLWNLDHLLMEEKIFQSTLHSCPICLYEVFGEDALRAGPCGHVICKRCLISYCEAKFADNAINGFTCPVYKCTTALPQRLIRECLSPQHFELYLERSLERMPGAMICPRPFCNSVVVIDWSDEGESPPLGHCTNCLFTFCPKCKDAWHPGDCGFNDPAMHGVMHALRSNASSKLRSAEQSSSFTFSALLVNEKIAMERAIALAEEEASRAFRQCPSCHVQIEKNGGCNHMYCTQCNTHFSWTDAKTCLKGVNEIVKRIAKERKNQVIREMHKEHVRIQDEIRARNSDVIKAISKKCPRCKALVAKLTNSNHLVCSNCRVQFCFLCVKPIDSTLHFSRLGCLQHTDLPVDPYDLEQQLKRFTSVS